jgi:hypothetical protein
MMKDSDHEPIAMIRIPTRMRTVKELEREKGKKRMRRIMRWIY